MPKIIPQMIPSFNDKEAKAVYSYIKSGGFITEFKKTQELEGMISKFTGSKYCVMTNNGTVSLVLALMALELKPGDEVLVPDLTMIASPNACRLTGIKPVLVDIENETLGMDLSEAKKAITVRTRAMMYVAFNGRCGDMNRVVSFCRDNKLFLIEDSAQALGSYYKKKHLGTYGVIGSFSFSVPKIISTGQGGALVTDSAEIYKKIKRLKDFGRDRGGIDIHEYVGYNFKYTDLQAVIGIEQMKKLPLRIKRKKEIYKRYMRNLSDIKEVETVGTDLEDTAPWFIDIYVKDRDRLLDYLKEKNIESRKIYPAINTQKIYSADYKNKKFPIAEDFALRGLWLPSFITIKDKEIDFITETISKYYEK